jgi:Sec-independent protein translocase protein TatA
MGFGGCGNGSGSWIIIIIIILLLFFFIDDDFTETC